LKINEKRTRLRNTLWPWVTEADLWLRSKDAGFTTIPRAMPLIGRALDQLSGKGFPLAQTYLVLWCLVFDEAFVEIKDSRAISYEAGFTGKRGETTWKQRMRKLQELGFIDIKPGVSHDMQYVLLLDPFQAIAQNFNMQTNDVLFQAIVKKQLDVGGRQPELSPRQLEKKRTHSGQRELIVILEYVDNVSRPIDVISKDNFISLTDVDETYAEAQSLGLAKDGARFVHKTKFKVEDNRNAILVLRSWIK
jgi:hypothetical protein